MAAGLVASGLMASVKNSECQLTPICTESVHCATRVLLKWSFTQGKNRRATHQHLSVSGRSERVSLHFHGCCGVLWKMVQGGHICETQSGWEGDEQ